MEFDLKIVGTSDNVKLKMAAKDSVRHFVETVCLIFEIEPARENFHAINIQPIQSKSPIEFTDKLLQLELRGVFA